MYQQSQAQQYDSFSQPSTSQQRYDEPASQQQQSSYEPYEDYSNNENNMPGATPEMGYDASQEETEYDKYGLLTSATCESFHSEEDNYWFHLRANFDQSGHSLVLYRLYDDFLQFQTALLEHYPVEAGTALPPDAPPGTQPRRIIPKMPGPTEYENDIICAQRVEDLTTYLSGLCALPDYLKGSFLFYDFLVPRAGDVYAVSPDEAMREQWRAEKERTRERVRALDAEVVEYLDQMGGVTNGMASTHIGNTADQGQAGQLARRNDLPPLDTSGDNTVQSGPFAGYSMTSSTNSSGKSSSQQAYNGGFTHHRQQSSVAQLTSYMSPISQSSDTRGSTQSGSLSTGSGINFSHPFAQASQSAPQQQQQQSAAPTQKRQQESSNATSSSSQAASNPPPFVKIKIFHRNTDDLIAIRVPHSIRLSALLDKVRERLACDVSHLRYRDESGAPLSPAQAQSVVVIPGGGRLLELRDDGELDDWIQHAQKLVAYVD